MTDSKDNDGKTKKLTLGGAKLKLGNAVHPKKLVRTSSSSGGSVVVEVKRGRISSNAPNLKLQQTSTTIDDNLNSRRLSALKSSQISGRINSDDTTLSKIAEINKQQIEADKAELERAKQENAKSAEQSNISENVQKEESHSKHKKSHDIKKDFLETEEKETKPVVKQKLAPPKKLKKVDIFHMLEEDEGTIPAKSRSMASIKRAREKEKRKAMRDSKPDKVYREVVINDSLTLSELANRMTEKVVDVTRELMKLGVMAKANDPIDIDTAELVVQTFGHTPKRVLASDIEDILIHEKDKPEDLKSRAPIVTVMGHVDHGKTSLLDALKSTDIVSKEAGGITQHIGAYSVKLSDDKMITFIDTPGHEAFTEMRSRGSKVTDIVVLVVAADDGIKAQTIEAINHAKAAEVPIIVAINKIDKPEANIDKVKHELLSHELIPEDLGGDIITVPVSARDKQNLDKLEEAILLVAEMQELKTNPNTSASGVVIESRVDKNKGVIATVLIQRGTLNKSDIVVSGTTYGRVKYMSNDKGKLVDFAGPSMAVEIYGLSDSPMAGEIFNVVITEKQARDITDYRIRRQKEIGDTTTIVGGSATMSAEDIFNNAVSASAKKDLNIIIKGDVQGSIEAIISSLGKIESDEVTLKIIHKAVGGINESDIALARASRAIIFGFNVRANNNAKLEAEKEKIDIRYYSVIYDLIDDVKSIVGGMLSPIIRENYIGSVDIRDIFNITKVGKIAGSYVTKGLIRRGGNVRLLRDNIVIHEGKIKTLKRFKEDCKEVKEGFECGIAFENYDDVKVGDKVEVFEIVEEKKQI